MPRLIRSPNPDSQKFHENLRTRASPLVQSRSVPTHMEGVPDLMHKITILAASLLILATLAMSDRGMADPGAGGEFKGLAGRIFAVEAKVVYSDDPLLPTGTVFNNCYYFNADGSWFDPLYPDIGMAVPGYWVQHADLPKIMYTATVSESAVGDGVFAGLLLTQTGVVTQSQGEGRQKLLAYTNVYFEGWPFIEVVSQGDAVEACPYF